MNILVGGGSGFIGSALCNSLRSRGHKVTVISRKSGKNAITWQQLEARGFPLNPEERIHVVFQFSGANIIERAWTRARKDELYMSRIGTTKILVDAAHRTPPDARPKLFISGSAVGIYPQSLESTPYDEQYSGPPSDDFGGFLVSSWEKVVDGLPDDIRRVKIRSGVVLSPHGGSLSQMVLPFKFGLGGVLGSGSQYFPYVHLEDEIGIILHAMQHEEITGPVNSVAPQAVTNKELTRTLGKLLHRPTFLNVPGFALKLALQERAGLLLKGVNVVPKKALDTGYKFKFPTLEAALADCLAPKKEHVFQHR